jgi:DNA polymerase III sliding clamp (beta) subunit (PCNA family)
MKPTYNLHHTNWKAVTSSDDLRPAMQGVLFDKENERLVATDGHVLLMMPVKEISETDHTAIIPVAAFDKKAESYTVTEEETTVHYSSGKKEIYPNIQELYPKYNSVLPKNMEEPVEQIGVDIEIIARLQKCLKPLADKKKIKIKLSFNGSGRGINFNLMDDPEVSGLIMPYSLKDH